MLRYGAAFVVSFVFALYWTPLMRKAALQLNIVARQVVQFAQAGVSRPVPPEPAEV